MALVKFGNGVAGMAGSINGTTFARNRYGSYARNRTKPVNPGSVGQQDARINLADAVARWRETLTAAQRTAWDLYAAAVSMKNRLGEVINLTGQSHYVRANAARFRASVTAVDAGPTELALPEKDSTLAVAISAATQNLSVTFDNTLNWAGETGGYMSIYASRPQSVTVNSFKGPYLYAGKIAGAATPPTSPATIASPFPVVAGQKVFVKAAIMRADGRLSEPFRVSCTVGS